MLRSRSSLSRSRLFIVAMALALAQPGLGAEPVSDPAVTTYGTRHPAAPPELDTFSFLVGSWTGTALARNSDGTTTEYQFDWIGRYVLDGMAIADEMRMADGGAVQGMSLRQFDAVRQTWAVEFLNFNRSFLRRQVGSGTGEVRQEGNRITIAQSGIDGALGREVYTLVDADHFTYSLDFSTDGGATWESNVTIEMMREEAP